MDCELRWNEWKGKLRIDVDKRLFCFVATEKKPIDQSIDDDDGRKKTPENLNQIIPPSSSTKPPNKNFFKNFSLAKET